VHEPDAPELAADEGLQAVLDRGQRVGEFARAQVPGGVLIDLPYFDFKGRVAATAQAIADGASVVYEASFLEDEIFVSVDILERRGKKDFLLVEVKSTLDVKEEHLPDVAVQMHVVRGAGLPIKRAELMHLNRECTFPDLSNLFVREDVTAPIEPFLRAVPEEADSLLAALAGPLPDVPAEANCRAPHDCPFTARCRPPLPDHHVSALYGIRATKIATLQSEGIETLLDLPAGFRASGPALRQIRSVRSGEIVVEPGLRQDLAALEPPVAYLDFETIMPAVPVWPGCHPYDQLPGQFSCHVERAGELEHHAWLAEGPDDPREEFARAVVSACAGAKTIVAYSASFEKQRIAALAKALPHLEPELAAVSARLQDLLAIVRNNVYHPDFGGSFSIKSVLPALVPGLGYDDLDIRDGSAAAATLEALLLDENAFEPSERLKIRSDLLSYCERDTLAMVRLHERLRELAENCEGRSNA
jgi:predicted RecB family nuclease